ncbi:hypothetical protein M5K25_026659 [Dendrobium thyrsiflorum]|uniref:RRM domain-containing protein n=1 Tax=Dendrobium thyrsiflorum TaxID=117978 RepID=A0ABD0TY71_DENTH
MTTLKGLHLAAAAVKPQNITNPLSKLSFVDPLLLLFSLLPAPQLILRHRILQNPREEGSFEPPHADEEPEDGQQQSSIESRRLYVGNLSFSMTSSELSDIFSEAGKIDQVEIFWSGMGCKFVEKGSGYERTADIESLDHGRFDGRFPDLEMSDFCDLGSLDSSRRAARFDYKIVTFGDRLVIRIAV